MFFGGDYFGFDDALFAAARLLEIVSRQPFGLAPLLADLPRTFATPEIRVDCAEEEKFAIWSSGPRLTSPSRYPVNTIDGVRITFPEGGACCAPPIPSRCWSCGSRPPTRRPCATYGRRWRVGWQNRRRQRG